MLSGGLWRWWCGGREQSSSGGRTGPLMGERGGEGEAGKGREICGGQHGARGTGGGRTPGGILGTAGAAVEGRAGEIKGPLAWGGVQARTGRAGEARLSQPPPISYTRHLFIYLFSPASPLSHHLSGTPIPVGPPSPLGSFFPSPAPCPPRPRVPLCARPPSPHPRATAPPRPPPAVAAPRAPPLSPRHPDHAPRP